MTRTATIERHYRAEPDRVFHAWIDVDLLTQWFGCGVDMLWTVHEWDPQPGGAIAVSLDMDGGLFEVKGQFIEVDRPNKIQYHWADGDVVTATFEAVGDGETKLTITHEGLSDEMVPVIKDGWTNGLSHLDTLLSR